MAVPYENTTQRRDTGAYYSPESRDLIESQHSDDFNAFGYKRRALLAAVESEA